MHIRKSDKVSVISGKEKGKAGRVLRVFTGDPAKAIVEKVNLIKRHQRKSQRAQQGGIIEKEAPLPVSKLMLICPKCDAVIRARKQTLEDGSRTRVCRKCAETIG